ncbi:conserved Plasmodium protein, unknown function [Plasmodium gonderi]|uniref:Uncharacterized protein n=1 Tax=Plasmodium gonderi TaxID=77519 RepID=A0A1Y1JHH0_PLAGO|nr:conserved Plasmodium protein, unknown function [Plasmodium gonderi]GAW80202.1 conserved Plasmodium protein, unknown function [Plasmodium gonderi]
MGCTQSKADEPKGPHDKDVQRQQSTKDECGRYPSQKSISTRKRNELDVKPPPVKAIPKISPKYVPKKGN